MKNKSSSTIELYPSSWNQYEKLKEKCAKSREPLNRINPFGIRDDQRGYKSPDGIYYFEKVQTTYVDMKKQTPSETNIAKENFFMKQTQQVAAEYTCYLYANAMGFSVPEKFSMTSHQSSRKRSSNWLELSHERVLALSEVKGITVKNLLDDPTVDPAKKTLIHETAKIEGLTAGLVFGDSDRSPSNMIINNEYVHIDLECACLSSPQQINKEWEDLYGEPTSAPLLQVVKSRIELAEQRLQNAKEIQGYSKDVLQKNITSGLKYLNDLLI